MNLEFKSLRELLIFNIKYYRFKEGLSQEKLAEYCNLSPFYISHIESGHNCPTIEKLERIAKSLNIEPYMLFQNPVRDREIVDKMNTNRQYNQKTKIRS